jgi:PAS domain S-box-containing protein
LDTSAHLRIDAARSSLEVTARILAALQEAVVAVDLDGHIIFWNAFAETLYGWRADEVLGLSLIDVLMPFVRHEAQQIVQRLNEGEAWIGEFPVQHRDGHELRVWVSDAPLRHEDGAIFGAVGFSVAADPTGSRRVHGPHPPNANVAARAQRVARDASGHAELENVIALSEQAFHLAQQGSHPLLGYLIQGVITEARRLRRNKRGASEQG